MHEATQRRLVRCAFLLFCVTPVLGVVGWSVVWALPSHVTRIENQLSRQLGVDVAIDQIEHPRPNELELIGVHLNDPETGTAMGQINQLTVQRQPQVTRLEADELVVTAEQRDRLWNCVHTTIVRHGTLDAQEVQFNVRRALVTNQSDQFLHDVSGRAWAKHNSLQATVAFQVGDSAQVPRHELSLMRDRAADPLYTHITFDTGENALPLALFSPALAAKLGDQSTARGSLDVAWRSNGWRATFSGDLDNIDLNGLTDALADSTTGAGTIRLDASEFTSDRLIRARGWLEFSDGTVDAAMVQRLLDKRVVKTVGKLPGDGSTIKLPLPFRQLAFTFDFYGDFVQLRGHRRKDQIESADYAVMIDGNGGSWMLTQVYEYRHYADYLMDGLRTPKPQQQSVPPSDDS